MYIQYRMNKKIMEFSSKYFYENKLVADKTVENHILFDMKYINEMYSSKNINISAQILLKVPLIFVDTRNFQNFEDVDTLNLSH